MAKPTDLKVVRDTRGDLDPAACLRHLLCEIEAGRNIDQLMIISINYDNDSAGVEVRYAGCRAAPYSLQDGMGLLEMARHYLWTITGNL